MKMLFSAAGSTTTSVPRGLRERGTLRATPRFQVRYSLVVGSQDDSSFEITLRQQAAMSLT